MLLVEIVQKNRADDRGDVAVYRGKHEKVIFLYLD